MDPQPGRPRHFPERTCVACRRTQPKRELIRLVRTPSQTVQVDRTGRAPGRGAYLCRAPACWTVAAAGKQLAGALRASLSEADRMGLRTFADSLTASEKAPVHDD